MKSKMILSLMPVLLAVMVIVGERAQAVDVGVGINIGGSSPRYYRGGSVVQYRTSDPVYSTWYPEPTTSYVYTPRYSTTYYDNGYGYGYTTPSTYVYSTNSTGYNGWYGSGRTGNGGYYSGRDYRNNNNHRDGRRR